MDKNSIIYVAGHRGFVGRTLLERLNREGYKTVTTNIDLTNQADVDLFFKFSDIDIVFNCAAKVGGIKANIKDPYNFLMVNLQIQNNLVTSAIKYGVKTFMMLSSSCCYPKDYPLQPLREEYMLQAEPEQSNAPYALAKIIGSKMAEYANKCPEIKTKFLTLAPSNLSGKGDNFDYENSHVFSMAIRKIVEAKESGKDEVIMWGTGQPRREFMNVRDLIDCMIWSIDNLPTDNFYNVGTGIDISIKELTRLVADEVGYTGKILWDETQPNGMMRKLLDVSRINALGWKAKISIEESIKESIEYFKLWRLEI